jgi:cytochrome c556
MTLLKTALRQTFSRKAPTAALAAVLAAAVAIPAYAQFQKPEDAVRYRQSAFNVMGNHFGRIGAMVNGRVPFDANAATINAEIVQSMSRLPFAGFGEGTDKIGNTSALPEVWSQPDKFKAAAQKMQDSMGKLTAAAKSGNADQLKAAFGETGATCKGCHDDFRKKP